MDGRRSRDLCGADRLLLRVASGTAGGFLFNASGSEIERKRASHPGWEAEPWLILGLGDGATFLRPRPDVPEGRVRGYSAH